MNTYHIEYEQTATGFSAYVPDLPGVVAAATSRAETEELIQEAIEFHLEWLFTAHNSIIWPKSPSDKGVFTAKVPA